MIVRTLMDALRDLSLTGLSVEQQILLNEVVMLASAPRPMSGAERTHKWRLNQRHVTNGDATVSGVTSVTQKENPPHPQKKNTNTPNEAKASLPPNPVQTKRGTRLPSDWKPPENLWDWGKADLGLSDETMRFETSAFRDHFCAAPQAKGLKLNWNSTWKNWMREAVRRRGKGHGPPAKKVSPLMTACFDLLEEKQQDAERANHPTIKRIEGRS